MTPLTNLREILDHVYPGLWNAAVAALAVLVLWLVKKFAPNTFAKLPPSVQALPAMAIAAIVSGLAANLPTIVSFLTTAFAGGLIGGVTAVGTHRVLKELPIPYGNDPGIAARKLIMSGLVLPIALLAAALVGACAGLQKGTAETCQFIDSGNPVVGTLCLTIEEIESIFTHVLATRELRSVNPSTPRSRDICDAPVPKSGL